MGLSRTWEENLVIKFGSKECFKKLILSGYTARRFREDYKCSYDCVIKYAQNIDESLIGVFKQSNARGERGNKDPVFDEETFKKMIPMGNGFMAKRLKTTRYYINKYAQKLGLHEELKKYSELAQLESRLKNEGKGSTYKKFKKDKCEKCNSKRNLQIHHIEPGIYDETNSYYISVDHRPANLQTLCSSCHLKVHYRELGRRPAKSIGTRFVRRKDNDENNSS